MKKSGIKRNRKHKTIIVKSNAVEISSKQTCSGFSAFDHKVLKIDKEIHEDITKVNFWIIVSLAIILFVELCFFNKDLKLIILNVYTKINKKIFVDILYYFGLLGTILISFDIYNSKKLIKIDVWFQDLLSSYYKAAVNALKYSVTLSDRNTFDNLSWYRNSLLMLLLFYVNYHYGNVFLETTISAIKYDLGKQLTIFLISIVTAQIVSLLDRDKSILDLIFITSVFFSLDYILNIFPEYKEYKTLYELLTVYMLTPYFFRGIFFHSEINFLKFLSWAVILIGAFPYLILKIVSRFVPIIVLYPFNLILKLSLYLKANMFLRHLGLSIYIATELLNKIFA